MEARNQYATGFLQDFRKKIDPAPEFGGETGHIRHDEMPLGTFVELDRPVEAIDEVDVPISRSPHKLRKALAVSIERRRDEMLNGDDGRQAQSAREHLRPILERLPGGADERRRWKT